MSIMSSDRAMASVNGRLILTAFAGPLAIVCLLFMDQLALLRNAAKPLGPSFPGYALVPSPALGILQQQVVKHNARDDQATANRQLLVVSIDYGVSRAKVRFRLNEFQRQEYRTCDAFWTVHLSRKRLSWSADPIVQADLC